MATQRCRAPRDIGENVIVRLGVAQFIRRDRPSHGHYLQRHVVSPVGRSRSCFDPTRTGTGGLCRGPDYLLRGTFAIRRTRSGRPTPPGRRPVPPLSGLRRPMPILGIPRRNRRRMPVTPSLMDSSRSTTSLGGTPIRSSSSTSPRSPRLASISPVATSVGSTWSGAEWRRSAASSTMGRSRTKTSRSSATVKLSHSSEVPSSTGATETRVPVARVVAAVADEATGLVVATVVVVGVSATGPVAGEGEARHAPIMQATTTAIAQRALVFTMKFLAWEDRGRQPEARRTGEARRQGGARVRRSRGHGRYRSSPVRRGRGCRRSR